MPSYAKKLIEELQADRMFKGTCPRCMQEFNLADALLFPIDEKPPEKAIVAITEAKQSILEQKAELEKRRERITTRAQKTAEAVNFGKIVEKIAPSFPTFSYDSGDCRALFEPIDYIIFSGLAKTGAVESITFADIKSGAAPLSKVQRSIKEIIQAGKVSFKITTSKERSA